MVENRLKSFRHVKRRHVDFVVRRVNQIERSEKLEVEEDLEKHTSSY